MTAGVREDGPFDLIVVGAGINGAAVAREAALAGVSVALFDRGDVGGGTTAASTRLIHGGLRYLEYAEIGLVYESLRERERLLELAPHLVQPLEITVPLYRGGQRRRWQIGLGLSIYDWLAVGSRLPRHKMLDRAALRARMPGLEADGLVGGAAYFDAQIAYPERLVVELVLDAVAHGAMLRTHSPVTGIRVEDGRAAGIEWRDRSGRARFTAGSTVVNAAGPWVDRVLEARPGRRLVGGTKGSHLVVEPFAGAPTTAVYTEAAADGRPFFIIPWNGMLLIGTTDLRYEGDPGDVAIDDAEVEYLAAATERVFPQARGLASRVLYTCSGVRPLPYVGEKRAAAITRRHSVVDHAEIAGLASIVGGKLTTHRALAEDLLRHVASRLPRPPGASRTRTRRLPGAASAEERTELLAQVGAELGAARAERLYRIYGRAALDVAARARATPEAAATVGPSSSLLVAELVHAVERERADGLADILLRRCMAGLDADFGCGVAEPAARWLVRLGLWDGARAEREQAAYRDLARRARARASKAQRRLRRLD